MSLAIVLSGGGSRGSYQIGVWKALKKLKIKYNIVTGTSVGAINGVLMVQNDLKKALNLWKEIDYNKIYTKKFDNNLINYFNNIIFNGGFEVSGLETLVKKNINLEKFYSSKIDYGLVTIDFTNLKEKELIKKEIPRHLLKDYVLASAACYPVFKKKKIGESEYIDGGYYDNIPINLALKLGASKIIAIDLGDNFKKEKYNNTVPITLIKPHNDLKFFLNFDPKNINKNITYGYNDTLKKFNKLDGEVFTFKKNTIIYLKKLYLKKMINKFNLLFKNKEDVKSGKNYNDFISGKNFVKIIENCGTAFKLNDIKIYNYKLYNSLLLDKIKRSNKNIKIDFSINKLEKNIGSKNLIIYIYNLMQNNNDSFLLYNLYVFFSNNFFSALYLSVIK